MDTKGGNVKKLMSMMYFCVFRTIAKIKIFYSVIVFYAINMVDNIKKRASFNMACKKRLNFFMFTRSPILDIKCPLLTSVIIISFLFAGVNSYALDSWKSDNNTDVIQGTSSPSDIDTLLATYSTNPLSNLLTHHIYGATLTWTSASLITVSTGEVTCSNAGDTIHRMRKNTATTTVNFAVVGVGGIDSGSHAGAEQASTWYSIYAVADAAATTFTAIATEQGTAPSDVTYYRYIGSVYNDAGKNILKFFCSGYGPTVTYMWDIPISVTTAGTAGVWSGDTLCIMPSSSNLGIFGLYANDGDGSSTAWTSIRPGSGVTPTWAISAYAGVGADSMANAMGSGQYTQFTDNTQNIQYRSVLVADVTKVYLEGFYLKR